MTYPPSQLVQSLRRSRAESAMDSTVVIKRGDLGGLDRTTGKVGGLENATTVYQGKARIRSVQTGAKAREGGGEVVRRQTTIGIPFSAPVPRVNDVVLVLIDDDPDVVRLALAVDSVDAGGYFNGERTLTCSGLGRSRTWNPA